MPGMFDMTPQQQGMLSAGLGILAGNQWRPLSAGGNTLGAALGQGGLMGLQAYNQAKAQQQADQLQQLRLALLMQKATQAEKPLVLGEGQVAYDADGNVIAKGGQKSKPPTVKQFVEGDQLVMKEYDETTGQWKEVSKGARYKPSSLTPYATVINTTEFGQVPFDTRAKTVTLPGIGEVPFADINKYTRGQGTAAIKPTDDAAKQADIAGAKAGAKVAAEASAKRQFNMGGLSSIISEAKSVLGGKAKPTGSVTGTIADKAGAFFGISVAGAPEADKLRVLGGALVAKMPRMEGPQSNYDVQNYREMAGEVGNSMLPVARRLAALEQVGKIWAKYENDPTGGAGGAADTTVDELVKKYANP